MGRRRPRSGGATPSAAHRRLLRFFKRRELVLGFFFFFPWKEYKIRAATVFPWVLRNKGVHYASGTLQDVAAMATVVGGHRLPYTEASEPTQGCALEKPR